MADDSDPIDPNAWMVTFGDLIMLLLTFFVLLLTMKSMDKQDTEEMFQYFIEAENPIASGGYKRTNGSPDPISGNKKQVRYITSNAMLKKTLKSDYANFRRYYDVDEDHRGLVVSLDSEHLFDSGKAKIRPEAYAILDLAGNILAKASNDVLILGHTDNVPIRRGRFTSNWDLSCYRALNVYHYMVDIYGVEQDRVAPGGMGETRPLLANTSAENRAKNRRVEFILTKK